MSWQRLRRLGSNSGGSSPLLGNRKKDDKEAANLTPLERMLQDSGRNGQPVQFDGNDKFFGFENFGNTCYANSILQSLYYSEPFREEVLTYPSRAPVETVLNGPDGQPRPTVKISPQSLVTQKPKNPNSPATATRPPNKPEDKNSAEYKKKQALLKGPVVPMDYDNSKSYGMGESLFTSLKDIFEGIVANQSRLGIIRPSKLVETLKKERLEFNTAQHQDAHEFLNLLLNSVIDTVEDGAKRQQQADEESKVSVAPGSIDAADHSLKANGGPPESNAAVTKSSQWVHDLFQGTLTSETVCLTCERTSHRDEPFIDLSVDIEQFSSVAACLRQFSEEEMLSEGNKFACDNCGYTESQKRMKIKRLPRILALHIKRFKAVDDGGWKLQKLFHRVSYPFHMRLFTTSDDAEDPDKLYELYAVVIHIGAGPFQGHYVSVIKTKDAGWVLFDDELVEPVKREFVENFFGDKPGQAAAYVLFYQETTVERFQEEEARESSQSMTPRAPAVPPVTVAPKSPGLGLTMSFLSSNSNRTTTIPETPIEEALTNGERLATVKTNSPSLRPANGPLSQIPSQDLALAQGTSADSLQSPASNSVQSPSSPSTTSGGFLNRMRRSSRSSKRPSFLAAALDMTKEGKTKDKGVSKSDENNKDMVNGHAENTPGEESQATTNGSAEALSLRTQQTSESQLDHATEAEQSAEQSGSFGKRRLFSLRRKPTDLRKSGSRANILGSRKEEKVGS